MENTYQINVVLGTEIFEIVWTAIRFLYNSVFFHSAIVALTVGGIVSNVFIRMWKLEVRKQLWYTIITIICIHTIFSYRTSVVIYNHPTGQNTIVNDVPTYIAAPIAYVDKLGESFDGVVKVLITKAYPAYNQYESYRKSSLAGKAKLLAKADLVKLPSGKDGKYYQSNMTNFCKNCVIHAVDQGFIDGDSLNQSKDIWGFLGDKMHKAYRVKFKILSSSGGVKVKEINCKDAYTTLNDQWPDMSEKACEGLIKYAYWHNENAIKDDAIKKIMAQRVKKTLGFNPISYDGLRGLADQNDETLRNLILANYMAKGQRLQDARYGVGDYIKAKTTKSMADTGNAVVETALELMPVLGDYLKLLMPLIMLLMSWFIYASDRFRIIKDCILILVVIQLSIPLNEILNMIICIWQNLELTGLTCENYPEIVASSNQIRGLAGIFSMAIIPLTWSLLNKNPTGISNLLLEMGRQIYGNASNRAAAAADSNFSHDNINFDTVQAENTNMGKHMMGYHSETPRITTTDGLGQSITRNTDGSSYVDTKQAISKLNVSPQYGKSLAFAHSDGIQTARRDQQNWTQSYNQASDKVMEDGFDFVSNLGKNKTDENSFTAGLSTDDAKVFSKTKAIAKTLNDGTDLNKRESWDLAAGLHANAPTGRFMRRALAFGRKRENIKDLSPEHQKKFRDVHKADETLENIGLTKAQRNTFYDGMLDGKKGKEFKKLIDKIPARDIGRAMSFLLPDVKWKAEYNQQGSKQMMLKRFEDARKGDDSRNSWSRIFKYANDQRLTYQDTDTKNASSRLNSSYRKLQSVQDNVTHAESREKAHTESLSQLEQNNFLINADKTQSLWNFTRHKFRLKGQKIHSDRETIKLLQPDNPISYKIMDQWVKYEANKAESVPTYNNDYKELDQFKVNTRSPAFKFNESDQKVFDNLKGRSQVGEKAKASKINIDKPDEHVSEEVEDTVLHNIKRNTSIVADGHNKINDHFEKKDPENKKRSKRGAFRTLFFRPDKDGLSYYKEDQKKPKRKKTKTKLLGVLD